MNYKIWRKNSNSKYLTIESTFLNLHESPQTVHLPAWRPGRYEFQNFAKYIKNVTATSENGEQLTIKKTSKDTWQVVSELHKNIKIQYEFYADIQNAGGSFVNNTFFYMNPINCCMYIENKQDEPCSVEIELEENKDVACGMEHTKSGNKTIFNAASFHDLVDSPIMISSKIQHRTYQCDGNTFHIWIKGKIEVPWEKVLIDFEKFTQEQINIFGEFPEKDYHFMLWMMPNAYYHGVEHKNSTMMTLGPDGQNFDDMYTDLLGLASHELFHTWNVKKIRPIELMPYDYSKENYFTTCFVAEGLTTFYGDWILYRSGVYTKAQYLNELETTLKRHFENSDSSGQSLLESSYDLWLDGYEAGIPNRKVSVYYKGAIAGLILHHLFQTTHKSLDDLMKMLWLKFGKPFKGYSYEEYQECCENLAGSSLSTYFKEVIEGNGSLKIQASEALSIFNFEMSESSNGQITLIEKQGNIT
jgi:predicted metalloprotease with PDZ domain